MDSMGISYSVYMKSLFPKPLTSTLDMLLICIIDFLWQLKQFKSHVPISGNFHVTYSTMFYKVIKSGNEWHAKVDRRGFGTKQYFIPMFFCMYVQNLRQG